MNPPIQIATVPALDDNYAFLIHGPHGTLLVDAPDAAPVRAQLDARKAKLTHILITHDHNDHVGGIAELRKVFGSQIIAPAGSRVPFADMPVNGGEKLELAGIRVEVLWTPGHCAAHVAFYLPAAAAVFTGDCLFGCGCGRLFGGAPEIMWDSLRRLAELPGETNVFFGHEYTRDNLRFTLSIEPDNAALHQRIADLEKNPVSVPSTIALEKATNPFLRARDAADFAERRRRKDSFR